MDRTELELLYIELGNELAKTNAITTLSNHCYWRIANDNACKAKWVDVIKAPFYKNASEDLLIKSVYLLQEMYNDKSTIQVLNKESLKYRKKYVTT